MIYALDTNIISFLLRPSQNKDVVQRFEEMRHFIAYVAKTGLLGRFLRGGFDCFVHAPGI